MYSTSVSWSLVKCVGPICSQGLVYPAIVVAFINNEVASAQKHQVINMIALVDPPSVTRLIKSC